MDNTVEDNKRMWGGSHHWDKDGDEWDGQARVCGVDYEKWKLSLIEHLIQPYATAARVIEIAPGYGRFSEPIASIADHLDLVDINQNCIDACKKRLISFSNVDYHLTDGKTLPSTNDGAIDFIFSFDSFVHMSSETIENYLKEARRVLRPGGTMIIHHANRKHLYLSFLRGFGFKATKLYRYLSQGYVKDDDGWRSNVSANLVRNLAVKSNLEVVDQMVYWDKPFGVPRFNDGITKICRP